MRLGAAVEQAQRRFAAAGPWPLREGHVEPSLIAPVGAPPSERLIATALAAIESARSVDLAWLAARGTPLAEVWPGEHYRLLTSLVAVLEPRTVVEVGTATGASALAIKAALRPDARLVTFDLVPWTDHPQAVLREQDLVDGRIEQRLEDLSTQTGLLANRELLRDADFIFVDAKHDGRQEAKLLQGFEEVGLERSPILMLDDIRVWKMLAFWQGLSRPRLDLTSFGHWSGTGLVDYQ